MALDAATLELVARELDGQLSGSRIDKIFQPTKDEVVLALRGYNAGWRLLISARSGAARVGVTAQKLENPQTPPSFCMLLRKYLSGGRLCRVRPEQGERIVFFEFACTNEMGDAVNITLAAELMGRYSNLVVINGEGKIIDALKRVDFEASSVRQLLPGLSYTLPQKQAGDCFFDPNLGAEQLVEKACRLEQDTAAALMKTAGGVGPAICREIAFRALGAGKQVASELSAQQRDILAQTLSQVRQEWARGGTPTLVKDAEGKPVEFSFTPLTQYLPGCTLHSQQSYSALLDDYYAEKDAAERMRQKSRNLHKTVHNLLERATRKQAARQEERQQSGESEQLRLFGELLQANQWAVQKGDAEVTVTNYYTGEPVTIPLDVRLSANANAQKYFKEYKKKQTAAKMLVELLAQGEREINYLASVLYEVEQAESEAALEEIRAELKGQGYLKSYKLKQKRPKPADFMRFISQDGFVILVGRNNLQNDKLTLHTARGRDWWFHTKNAPGSHTVVLSEGKPVPDTTKNEAAMLAVFYSSQAHSAKVPVDYTQVKNIRKTGDLAPGMVLYEHYETAYITPDEQLLRRLGAKR